MKAKTGFAIQEVRVFRYDDKKILRQYIIGQNWGNSTPTIKGIISHLAYRRRTGPPEVQVKFKTLTHPFIKEEIITIGTS